MAHVCILIAISETLSTQLLGTWTLRLVFKGLRPEMGNAGSTKRDPTYFLGFPAKTPKMTTSGPNPGSRAQNLGLGQMRSFLVVLGGVYTNVTTSGPNPWFLAQSHGFGPDVVIFTSWCQPKAIIKHIKNTMTAA